MSSVTVHPRARDSTVKCIVRERHNHSQDVCILLAHTLVNPVTHVIHQHTTPPSSASRELMPGTGPHLAARRPAKKIRTSHNENAGSTFAVVAAAIPEPTKSSDLGPRNLGSVHPFFHPPLRALFPPTNQVLYCVHERHEWPSRQSAVVDGTPRHHHARRRCGAVTTLHYLVFSLE